MVDNLSILNDMNHVILKLINLLLVCTNTLQKLHCVTPICQKFHKNLNM